MIKRLIEDNLPCAMLKGIPISEADAKKYLGVQGSVYAHKEDFRLACMHTAPANSVSVIGASHFPKTSFPWYDGQGNKITFPETEVAYWKEYTNTSGTSYYSFTPNRTDHFYWDNDVLYGYASALLEKTRVNYGIPDGYDIVPPDNPYVQQNNFSTYYNKTQAYDTMSFKTKVLDAFYSGTPGASTLIQNMWTDEIIIGNGNGGITVSTCYKNGMAKDSDGPAGCKLIVDHSTPVKMGIECIISGDGLDTYLNTPRNSQTYWGVDGIFNIVTKGLREYEPNRVNDCSCGITKFYNMKKDCRKIAPNTYYLNDDNYYTIQSSDNYAGTSAYIHATMFANGMPNFQVNTKHWVVKRTYKNSQSKPSYYLGCQPGAIAGDPDTDVWGSPFGKVEGGVTYNPYGFDDEAAAQNFIINRLSQYYPLPIGDTIEPEYTYSQLANSLEPWTPWKVIGQSDFPDRAVIIALNYHFTAV
jgi:hypothetical protein